MYKNIKNIKKPGAQLAFEMLYIGKVTTSTTQQQCLWKLLSQLVPEHCMFGASHLAPRSAQKPIGWYNNG